MYSKILIIISLVGLIIVGFIKLIYEIYKYTQDYNFVNEYISRLIKILNDNMSDEDFSYILNNASKLSSTMGVYGIIDYQPPFANYIHKNYSIINIILNYNGSIMNDELLLALKTMQFYLGACDNRIEKLKNQLKNPLVLFAEGFRFIFNIPLFVLNSLGIISNNVYYKVKRNIIYSFIQNIFGLIGFISSLIGIIQGKEVMLQVYNKVSYFITSIF
ncbi:MAG: hypothetical protein AB2417_01490 [Clostridiaceae bacterium]